MKKLQPLDKALLWTFLPLFAVCFTLHIREIERTGLAQPPVFAVPDGGDYPLVGGLRLERGRSWNDLDVGDRLIQVGDVDLRGSGYLSFDAIVMEQAGTSLVAPATIVRDGQRRSLDLHLLPYATPWVRIPFLLAMVATSVLVLVRSPGTQRARLFFAAFMIMTILQAPFLGGPRLQSFVHLLLFNLGWSVGLSLMLLWIIGFPNELPLSERLPKWLALLGLTHGLVRLNYIFGGPLPPESIPGIALAADAMFAAVAILVLTWNYRRSTPIGRRRIKWFLTGVYLGLTPAVLVGSVGAVKGGLPGFDLAAMIPFAYGAAIFLPAGILVGILRYNLFDIDRLITATAAYSLATVALVAGMISVVPRIARPLAQSTGLGEDASHLALALAVAAVLVPFGRRFGRVIDRLFFPDRLVVESGIRSLIRDLSYRESLMGVADLIRDRLDAIYKPRLLTTLEERDGRLVSLGLQESPTASIHDLRAADFDGVDTPLQVRLTRSTEQDSKHAGVLRSLRDAGVEICVPLRAASRLDAVVLIGQKGSADIYTPMDLALLGAVAEKASAELARLQDREVIEHERRKAESLDRLAREAEEANRAKTRFLAAASHDLRQPLHSLGLLTEILSERAGQGELGGIAEKIRRSTEGLSEMFDALLDLSKLDSGAVEKEERDFDLGELIESLLADFETEARQKGLRLLSVPSSMRVRSDPVLLRRILLNLLANALRYTESGHVLVRATPERDSIRIDVEDTGCGIPLDRQEEIFQEFVQLKPSANSKGLGLGLSIVKRLCRLLGHEIRVVSDPGKGSVFSIWVPWGAQQARPRDASEAIPAIDFSGRLAVVIDDDLEILDAMRELLNHWGLSAVLAESGRDAVDGLRTRGRRADVILADYRLQGGETGVDAIAAVRAYLGANVPALVITGEALPGNLPDLRGSSIPVLHKPLRPAKLRALLLEILR